MAKTISNMIGAQVSLACTGAWQPLFATARSGSGDGVLIRNTSAIAVEIGDPAQAAALATYGWYQIPAQSTFFVPFPNGVFAQLHAKGLGATIIYQEVTVG